MVAGLRPVPTGATSDILCQGTGSKDLGTTSEQSCAYAGSRMAQGFARLSGGQTQDARDARDSATSPVKPKSVLIIVKYR